MTDHEITIEIPKGTDAVVITYPENFTRNEVYASQALAEQIRADIEAGRVPIVFAPEHIKVRLASEMSEERIREIAHEVVEAARPA